MQMPSQHMLLHSSSEKHSTIFTVTESEAEEEPESESPPLDALSLIVYDPILEYEWIGYAFSDIVPSPKFHSIESAFSTSASRKISWFFLNVSSSVGDVIVTESSGGDSSEEGAVVVPLLPPPLSCSE